jgi:hypothetical protein|uniref:thiol oxidase n=1 Tax=viral metagenome TaxID=1070528 RepID=A0A6C0IJU6_9ZZZZ
MSTKNTTRKMKRVFKKNEFKSNDGILTSVWGPSMWHSMHSISFNYPINPTTQNKKEYRDFILNLQHILPCGKCRENLKNNFKTLPLTMDKMKNRETFSRYVYDLHEVVNTMLGKKSALSYEDVRERYEHFRARCLSEDVPIKTENGCVEPLYGIKSKCVLKIVPYDEKCETLEVDNKCLKQRK